MLNGNYAGDIDVLLDHDKSTCIKSEVVYKNNRLSLLHIALSVPIQTVFNVNIVVIPSKGKLEKIYTLFKLLYQPGNSGTRYALCKHERNIVVANLLTVVFQCNPFTFNILEVNHFYLHLGFLRDALICDVYLHYTFKG